MHRLKVLALGGLPSLTWRHSKGPHQFLDAEEGFDEEQAWILPKSP